MLAELYREMVRLRETEEAIAAAYPEWEMRCPTHLSSGQEGVPVGVCRALTTRDYVLGGHRAHGHYLAKGGDLRAMMAELYGKVTGCAQGKGGSMHLIDLSVGFLGAVPIVGSTIPIAVGCAFGTQQQGDDRVTVCFFGDAATEEGLFNESLNFAALRKLPVLFVSENNRYSVYSPLSVRQPQGRDLAAIVRGHGVHAESGDGNDVEEVYRLSQEAVARARSGQGPTFLEFSTYRFREHCGPFYDDELGYRPEGELAHWQERCGLKRLEERLLSEGTLTSQQVAGMRAEIQAEISDAFQFAKESPFPQPELLLQDVFAEERARS